MGRCEHCPSRDLREHLTCRDAAERKAGATCNAGWQVCCRCGSVQDRKGRSAPSERILSQRREAKR